MRLFSKNAREKRRELRESGENTGENKESRGKRRMR